MKSIHRVGLGLVGLAALLSSSCGGAAGGFNAIIDVILTRTDSTQIMTNYELFITKNGDTTLNQSDPEDFMSTVSAPTWADDYSVSRTATSLRIRFTTRSTQPPYFVWVKVPNTTSSFETLAFQIDVESIPGTPKNLNLTVNSTQRLTGVQINRSDAVY